MRWVLMLALAFGAFSALVQEPAQPRESEAEKSCYKDKGVDEYIGEIKRLQTEAKRRGRFSPSEICVFSFCTKPTTHPNEAPAGSTVPSPARRSAESSSVMGTYDPVAAAHNTEVGDFYYKDKNYRGALMRYRDALQQKRGDPAIHLRLGRAYEKLKENEHALVAYDSAQRLEPEGKTAAEARAALERLRPALKNEGRDPEALARDNPPKPAPCLAPPAAN